MRNARPLPLLLAAFLLVSAFGPGSGRTDPMSDMEKDFFRDQEAMETEYRDFEREAFNQFKREVEALWNDFEISTKKDWVEYSGDKSARSRVDFENGTATVEVLIPKEELRRDPRALQKRLENELEQLVVDRGKVRDYPVEAPSRPPPAPQQLARKEGRPAEDAFGELEQEAALRKEPVPAPKPRPATPPAATPPRPVEAASPETAFGELEQEAALRKEPVPAPKPPPATPPPAKPPGTKAPPADSAAGGKKTPVPPPQPLLTTPVLENQIKTLDGKVVTPKNKEVFAKEVLKTQPVQEQVLKTSQGEMVKASITFSLVPDHLRIRAERHLNDVRKNAERFRVSVPLAFAVIHTESYFNPKARSHVPAYGLMQLVPTSGGRDAYRYVYGKDKVLGPDYLYQPDKNIELGCAYLGLLQNRYFRDVKDPKSAQYCAIASYNTGAGNLSRAVSGQNKLAPAVRKVNTMTPKQLYAHLKKSLPYEETQDYLERVSQRMDLYREWE